jgi:transcriptional regulator with XRE-family HTH domain
MDHPELEKLGKRIRELRIQKGFSNYEHFAYEIGVSRSQYGKYELGHNLTFLTLLKILKGLDVSLEDFFSEGF